MTRWLKVAQPQYMTREALASLLNELRSKGFNAGPAARITSSGMEVTWMPGRSIDSAFESFNLQFWNSCGVQLRRLHDLSQESVAVVNPLRVNAVELKKYDSCFGQRAAHLGLNIGAISTTEISLGNHSSVLHGDLSLGNIIGDGPGDFVGFIDWEYARRGPAIIDLANLFWQMLSARPSLEKYEDESINALLSGYGYPNSFLHVGRLLVATDFIVDRRIQFLTGIKTSTPEAYARYRDTLALAVEFQRSIRDDPSAVIGSVAI